MHSATKGCNSFQIMLSDGSSLYCRCLLEWSGQASVHAADGQAGPQPKYLKETQVWCFAVQLILLFGAHRNI